MNIKAEITRTFKDKGALLASAAVIFDDNFIVKNLRVIEGNNGVFVAMPNFKNRDGRFIDTCFPLNTETRDEIQDIVLEAYEAAKDGDGKY
jgi:stage V sporulation protein G